MQRGHYKERKLQANDPDEHRCKYPSKTLANRTEEHGKRTTHCEYVGFIPGNQEGSKYNKVKNVIMPHY